MGAGHLCNVNIITLATLSPTPIRPSLEEPPLPVEVRHPLARPDGAVVVGDGGAVTPQPPVRQIHRLHRVVVVKFQGPGEDGPDRHLGKL